VDIFWSSGKDYCGTPEPETDLAGALAVFEQRLAQRPNDVEGEQQGHPPSALPAPIYYDKPHQNGSFHPSTLERVLSVTNKNSVQS
jgi:hypothetical protein